ncbi:hypothetical protein BDV95DRAFT_610816 [Massariosphaeria phaeospora]|uniref:Transcription factor hoxa13 n=1 Tax=Massariosphaeria phaeospora TaxID=100035 RepID=A0A7C8M1U1_9PLEO|nr:hypothetical protein BDV95DRAFT_610816 [Massariosphaeria phaeospora]
MSAQTNGRAKKPKKSGQNGSLNGSLNGNPNGHMNGDLNGHLNGQLNGHVNGKLESPSKSGPMTRQAKQARPQKSTGRTFTGIVGRLLSWYLIVTALFRCPSSLTQISETSPRVCKPYLHARSYATPYLDPYYQTYVAPQVEKVQPYVDGFDKEIYSPVATFTKDKYATYGAHRVDQAQKYAEAEWARTVSPQLHNAQNKVKAQYNVHLGPHVKQGSDMVAPYYEQTKDSLAEIYHLTILPSYEAVHPYALQGYAYGNHIVTHLVFPYVRYGRDAGWAFISRTLWPQVRVLYGANVEPQLVRISERLGRYKDQQKVESVAEAVDSAESVGSAEAVDSETPVIADPTEITPTVASPSTTSTKAGWGVLDDFFGADSSSTQSTSTSETVKTATRPPAPKLTGAELRQALNDDLRKWQSKFAVAADKGAEDLEQRVSEITKRQVEHGIHGHGAALVVQLEESAESTVARFKQFIKQTVKGLPEDAKEQDLEAAYEKSVAKTRELGLSVKGKAQAVRSWKASYDQETDSLVKAAVKSTLDVLGKIHGLGLQEVGMRWAWTDGVTYKDWQNYHKLRNTLTEWQAEVEAVGSKHEGLKTAHEEAKNLEDKAMTVASEMVSELVRLKDVSRWKIWAEDTSDDFADKKVPARAFKAAQEAVENVEGVASKASEAVLGSETPATESVVSVAKASISEVSSKLSESIIGTKPPATESVASEVKRQASAASSKASEAVVGGAFNVKSGASQAAEKVEAVAEEGKKKAQQAAASASQAPKKVMGGAMAQVLAEAKQVVFDEPIDDDDDDTYTEKVQNVAAEAGDRAADISRAVSEALFGPAKTQGSIESVTSLASGQYAKALAAASTALYGTDQPAVESATSVASDKFAQAFTAASYAIYGTPTPTAVIKTVQNLASSRYNNAISIANEQYSNAKSQLSELVSGTPKPAHETMLSFVEKAYSDSVAAASERLQVALQYTDSMKSYAAGPTQGYFESVSSIAASRLSEGLSQATAQFSSQPTSALDGPRRQYYEAIGLAHARYSEFIGAASSAVYGPEQGTIASLASVASESAASVASQVSSSVVGSETPWAESVASGASNSAQSAASRVSEAAGSLASQASSSVVGTETPWTESVASQASHNWEALIAKASNQVYGAPTPWAESVYSQVGAYGAQATAQAGEQYAAVQALISELVVGREPDFTESVMNRFSSAYYIAIPAVVSSVNSYASQNAEAVGSYASEGYDSATSYAADAYASASSVVSSIFTPPPAIETILSQASDQINLAVESASVAVYGTTKGNVEQASDSIASAYSSVQSKASEAVYGTKQAQDSFTAVAASAQAAISQAIFGTPTPTGYAASATSGVGSAYSSVSSVVGDKAADAASAISSAIYGPEQGAVESASNRIAAAVEAANARISEIYANAAKGAEGAASSVSSAVTEATQRVRDEL